MIAHRQTISFSEPGAGSCAVHAPGTAKAGEEEFVGADVSGEWRDELMQPAGWTRLLETFAATMKLAVVLTDVNGRPLDECHNPQPFWNLASATVSRAAHCPFCLAEDASCTAVKDSLSTGKPVTAEDDVGLSHITVPLIFHGQQLGALVAGQVFTDSPDLLPLGEFATDLGVSRSELWQAVVDQVPVPLNALQLCGTLLASLGQAVLGERFAAVLQRKLLQTSRRYRLFIEGVKEYALYTVDRAGKVTSWNPGAERLFGYAEDEIIGRAAASLVAPGVVDQEASEQSKIDSAGGGSAKFEGWRLRKDGSRFFASGVLASIGHGSAREFGRLVRDDTSIRRSEQDLQQAKKLEGIGVLAGGIAHDFNNLLTGIVGSLSFVKSSLPPGDAAYRMVELAERSSLRASELVAQLLAYAGKGKFVVTRFDLSALISEMLSLIAASIPKTVELELDLAPDLPWMQADASQIRQVVMNLIINGAEAIGPEGGAVEVVTGVSDSGNEIFMQVKDSGSGMTEATKAKMFDPFFTTKSAGKGLGLSAVAGIVRGHQGRMEVESAPGAGSTFTVTFPAVLPGISDVPDEPLSETPQGSGAILVVDDEPALREMAAAILENAGYTALGAKDGREAVEIFRQDAHRITAVLLDMTMPVMGGFEAFRLIREIDPAVPIVVSSGYSESATRADLGEDAEAGFIQKPYRADRLVASIHEALQDD